MKMYILMPILMGLTSCFGHKNFDNIDDYYLKKCKGGVFDGAEREAVEKAVKKLNDDGVKHTNKYVCVYLDSEESKRYSVYFFEEYGDYPVVMVNFMNGSVRIYKSEGVR